MSEDNVLQQAMDNAKHVDDCENIYDNEFDVTIIPTDDWKTIKAALKAHIDKDNWKPISEAPRDRITLRR